jgi:hypothetical protein
VTSARASASSTTPPWPRAPLQAESGVERVLIVDLDVHQGDGTAALLAHDATVLRFSMHGRRNFPFRKCASDLDVELDDGTGDAVYLATLRAALSSVLARFTPDLAIYLAGADPYAGDRLGRLALSKRASRRATGSCWTRCEIAACPSRSRWRAVTPRTSPTAWISTRRPSRWRSTSETHHDRNGTAAPGARRRRRDDHPGPCRGAQHARLTR